MTPETSKKGSKRLPKPSQTSPKWPPEASRSLSWHSPGPHLARDPFFTNFGLHFGPLFGGFWGLFLKHFFYPFLGRPPEASKSAKGIHFCSLLASILVAFWHPCEKVKMWLPCWRGPYFHCPKGPENRIFLKLFPNTPRGRLQKAF